MAIIPVQPTMTAQTKDDLIDMIVDSLASARCVEASDLQAERTEGNGDLEVTSLEAVAIIVMMESRLGRTLAKVEDLEPEVLTSVASLAELFYRRWSASERPSRDGQL